jgi:ABC-2 type transport system permease protein
MKGFPAFFRKELSETVHTWRLWVLPGFLLFAAVTSPLLTYLMPALLERFGGEGMIIELPDPTAAAAYVEYLSTLTEIVVLALVIAYGGIVSSEIRSGTGALTLAKPLSRGAFVLAKWLSQLLVLIVAGVVATAIAIAITAALLGLGPARELAAATGLWLVFAGLMLCAMALLSVVLRAPAAASGAGIAVYAALIVMSQLGDIGRSSPAGLLTAPSRIILGQPAPWTTPLITAFVLGALLLGLAVWLFSRREI